MIELHNVYKNFKKKEVLKDVSFQIHSGDIVGLLGPNGVGKTTLIKLMCGINNPTSGEIQTGAGNEIAVVFDYNGLYSMFNAVENLKLFSKNEKKIEEYLKIVGLWEYRKEKVSKYSKGMLRKLTIARALMKDSHLLILDEPFDGLDVESRSYWSAFFNNWVKEGDRAILISSHIMSDIEDMCNRVLILSDGKLICDASKKKLEENSEKFLKIKFSKSCNLEIIHKLLEQYEYSVPGNVENKSICLYGVDEAESLIIDQLLEENNCQVIEKYFVKNSLTETYLHMVKEGGGNNV